MFTVDALTPEVEKVARHLYYRAMYSVSLELSDLIQEGMIEAWKAYNRYDPEKALSDSSFMGFCLKYARGGMLKYLRGEFDRSAISLEEWLEVDGKEGTYTRDIEDKQVTRVVASLSQRRKVLKMLRTLPVRERAVLRAAFRIEDSWGQCFEVDGVMKRYRISKSNYYQIRTRALKRLAIV